MADELWNAGDKVKLTGSHWNLATTPYERGDIVTLEKCLRPGEWQIEGGGGIYVTQNEDSAWAGVRLATGGYTGGGYVPAGVVSLSESDAALIKSLAPKTEVRTTSSTGGEKGVKPEAFALIPWEAMDEVARVYNAGAEKYAAHNWRRGYEWSKSFSAACRHLFAFWRGEDRDPELGTLHLANAAFHILGMITFSLNREKYGDFDDRYTSTSTDSDG